MSGRRVGYDRVWGPLLALSALLPAEAGASMSLVAAFAYGVASPVFAWIALGTAAGALAAFLGFRAARSRKRHLVNFVLGAATLAVPVAFPRIWAEFPDTNPARFALGTDGAVGAVLLLALTAVYAGSGYRIVRPSQIAGQAIGGLGAFLFLVFALVPVDGGEAALKAEHWNKFLDPRAHWREVVPFGLVALGLLVGLVNLVQNRAEVFLARVTRLLLVGALLFWAALPFFGQAEAGGGDRWAAAWGALRLFGPAFLALDGCVAVAAISFSRSDD